MIEEEKKIQNGKEIADQIKILKKDFSVKHLSKTEEEDEVSFLDRLNRLVQLIMNDSSLSIYTTLDKESLDKWKKGRFTRIVKNLLFKNFRNFLYLTLLATITAFLVSEALDFYAIDGVISANTYVKAILTEICFIFLSGYRAAGKLLIGWVGLLRVGVFALMMFVITSQTLMQGTESIENTNAIQQQIVILEKQISSKDKEIEYYRNKNWPITTKQLIQKKSKLVDKLLTLKDKQASGSSKEVSKQIEYKMYGKAAFRVLLLFISVLITRRLFFF